MLIFHIISVVHADNTLCNVLLGTTPDRTQIHTAISRRYALSKQRFEPVSSRKQAPNGSVKYPVSTHIIQKQTSGFGDYSNLLCDVNVPDDYRVVNDEGQWPCDASHAIPPILSPYSLPPLPRYSHRTNGASTHILLSAARHMERTGFAFSVLQRVTEAGVTGTQHWVARGARTSDCQTE